MRSQVTADDGGSNFANDSHNHCVVSGLYADAQYLRLFLLQLGAREGRKDKLFGTDATGRSLALCTNTFWLYPQRSELLDCLRKHVSEQVRA